MSEARAADAEAKARGDLERKLAFLEANAGLIDRALGKNMLHEIHPEDPHAIQQLRGRKEPVVDLELLSPQMVDRLCRMLAAKIQRDQTPQRVGPSHSEKSSPR